MLYQWSIVNCHVSFQYGGRGIRTPGAVPRTTVFKTAGFNHSPIPPMSSLTCRSAEFQILNGEVVNAIWFFRSYLHWERSGIRVTDGNHSQVCSSVERDVAPIFGFDMQVLSVLESYGHGKWLAPFIRAEFDFGNDGYRQLPMKFSLAINEDGFAVAALNES